MGRYCSCVVRAAEKEAFAPARSVKVAVNLTIRYGAKHKKTHRYVRLDVHSADMVIAATW